MLVLNIGYCCCNSLKSTEIRFGYLSMSDIFYFCKLYYFVFLFTHFSDLFKIGIWKDLDSIAVHPDLISAHQNIKKLSQRAKSTNTVRSYYTYFKAFCKWCKLTNLKRFLAWIIL